MPTIGNYRTPVEAKYQSLLEVNGLVVPRRFGKPTLMLLVSASMILICLIANAAVASAQCRPDRIAFSSDRNGGSFEVYSMNPDGTGQTRLTNNAAFDADASISADGSRIVFMSRRNGNAEIYSMNPDGTSQTRLTNNTLDDGEPNLSHDGGRIVYVSSVAFAVVEIFVMNYDGTGKVRLTNDGTAQSPEFSPDGSRIVFTSRRDGGNTEIYSMNSDGTDQIRLTNNIAGDSFPTFSPDGSLIVFSSTRAGQSELFSMHPNGTSVSRLTNNTVSDSRPEFSPDGSRIAYESNLGGGNFEVFTINADGTDPVRLTNLGGFDGGPSWGGSCHVPTISAAGVTRDESTSENSQIGTVSDIDQAENSLTVTAAPTSGSGVTVANIAVDASGNVTADVSAACGATDSTFDLTVTDVDGFAASDVLTVTVTPETFDPVIDPIANVIVTLPADSSATSMAVSFPLPTATDDCSVPTVTTDPVSGSIFNVGTTTVNVTATDARGNAANATFTVTVQYNFLGFFQPVDNLPAVNVKKAGSSVPIKFSLSGNKGLNIFAVGYPVSTPISCDTGEPGGPSEHTVTSGGSTLSYDAAADRYSYVWKTSQAWTGTCRMLTVRLNDGTEHLAKFSFR